MPSEPTDFIVRRGFRFDDAGINACRFASAPPGEVPERPHQRWSLDFVSDALWDHRRCRVLNIVDPCTRECPGQSVDTSLSGKRLARYLDELAAIHGYPEELVHDNGPELTSRAMFEWSQRTGVKQRFIEPGKPIQNAYVESFNGQFRDECLNEHGFANLAEARQIIEAWRCHYNEVRPHSALGYQTPAAFIQQGHRQKRDLLSLTEPCPTVPVMA